LLPSYTGWANCTSPIGTINNADCNAYDGEDYTEDYQIEPTNGLTFYLIATVDVVGLGYSAYSSISWQSSGPVSFYDYYPGATYSPYYYDAYADPGNMTLTVDTEGEGSHAYVAAGW